MRAYMHKIFKCEYWLFLFIRLTFCTSVHCLPYNDRLQFTVLTMITVISIHSMLETVNAHIASQQNRELRLSSGFGQTRRLRLVRLGLWFGKLFLLFEKNSPFARTFIHSFIRPFMMIIIINHCSVVILHYLPAGQVNQPTIK